MDFSRVTAFIDSLESEGIPGIDLSIYIKSSEIYRRQTGFADIDSKRPIQPDTLFAIWSMTKVVACAAALRLHEEGRYVLTDPISEYLPEFTDMTYRRRNADGTEEIAACKRQIRIVDLFTMSSGLSYDSSPALENAAENTENIGLREFIAALSAEPLCFEPGTHWCYGFSHDVIGRLIEVLSGKSFGEYLQEHIFTPLNMNDTFIGINMPTEKAHRLASVYSFDRKTSTHKKIDPLPWPGKWRFESAGGGLVSSVDDYAKFANALCAGGTASNRYRMLGKATVELMRTNHLNRVRMRDYNWVHHSGYGYGLGVRTMVDRSRGGSLSNIGEFGWSGMLGTYVLMDPAAELTYVYAQQLTPSREDYVAPRLRNVIYSCL